jgi:hypothetical protein
MRQGLLHTPAILSLRSDNHSPVRTACQVHPSILRCRFSFIVRCALIGEFRLPRFPRSTIKLLCTTALQAAVARAWPNLALVAFAPKLQRALTILFITLSIDIILELHDLYLSHSRALSTISHDFKLHHGLATLGFTFTSFLVFMQVRKDNLCHTATPQPHLPIHRCLPLEVTAAVRR